MNALHRIRRDFELWPKDDSPEVRLKRIQAVVEAECAKLLEDHIIALYAVGTEKAIALAEKFRRKFHEDWGRKNF